MKKNLLIGLAFGLILLVLTGYGWASARGCRAV